MNDLEKKLPKKIQQELKRTRKLAEKQIQEQRDTERKRLREVADKFLEVIKQEVNDAVLLVDSERLDRLVSQVNIIVGFGLVKEIQDHGFGKELTALCDKVGRGKHDEV